MGNMNIVITQPKNLDVLKDVEPHLIVTDPCLRSVVMSDLKSLLINHPMAILFLTWYDEETKHLRAFGITVDPGVAYPYASVYQMWSRADNPRNWFDPFFSRMVLWSIAHNKEYIRADTQRNTEAMCRRFGFEPHLQTVKYDLSKSVLHQQLKDNFKEIAHGRW